MGVILPPISVTYVKLRSLFTPKRHYIQTEDSGFWGRPIVNNCTTCALRNLLALNKSDKKIEVVTGLHDMLVALEAQKPSLYEYIAEKSRPNPDGSYLQLKTKAVAQFLELLGTEPEMIYGGEPQNHLRLKRLIKEGNPLLMLDSGTQTLSGDRLPPDSGHCYLIYPNKQGECMISDSNYKSPWPISTELLLSKLLDDAQSAALIINAPPDPKGFYKRLNAVSYLPRYA